MSLRDNYTMSISVSLCDKYTLSISMPLRDKCTLSISMSLRDKYTITISMSLRDKYTMSISMSLQMYGASGTYRGRRDAPSVWLGKLEGKRQLGRARRRWEDNTKMILQEI